MSRSLIPLVKEKKPDSEKMFFAFTEYHLKYIICHCQSLLFVIMKSKK